MSSNCQMFIQILMCVTNLKIINLLSCKSIVNLFWAATSCKHNADILSSNNTNMSNMLESSWCFHLQQTRSSSISIILSESCSAPEQNIWILCRSSDSFCCDLLIFYSFYFFTQKLQNGLQPDLDGGRVSVQDKETDPDVLSFFNIIMDPDEGSGVFRCLGSMSEYKRTSGSSEYILVLYTFNYAL